MLETKKCKAIVFSLFLLICWNGLSSAQTYEVTNKGESERERALKEQEKEKTERKETLYKKMIEQKNSEAETFINVAERLIKESDDPDSTELLKRAKEEKHAGLQFAMKNEYEKALKSLKKSYSLAVQIVKNIRQDKSVTHKIIFGTPQEEYAYHKDRNDTYLKLASRFVMDGEDEAKRLFEEARMKREKAEDAFRQERYVEAAENMGASCDFLENVLEILAPKQ